MLILRAFFFIIKYCTIRKNGGIMSNSNEYNNPELGPDNNGSNGNENNGNNGNGNNGYIKGYLGGKIIRLDNVWILGMG